MCEKETLTHKSTSISRQRNETHFQTAAEAAEKHVLCISPNANRMAWPTASIANRIGNRMPDAPAHTHCRSHFAWKV